MMRMRKEGEGKNNKKKKEEIGIYYLIEASPNAHMHMFTGISF